MDRHAPRRKTRTGIDNCVLATLALTMFAVTVVAQEENCTDCHEDVTFESPAHPDLFCGDCHTNVPPEHDGEDLESLTDAESCAGCHRRPHREISRSVHAGETTCADCHGDPHRIHEISDLASAVSPVNQIHNCGACHDEPDSLIEGYLTSEHGKGLLVSGLIDSATCSDCHGAHGILGAEVPRDQTSRERSPQMCGSCHVLVYEEWRVGSAHGMAWHAGDETGPVCVDCHAPHDAAQVDLQDRRVASPDDCGGCHEEEHRTFGEGFHGKAVNLGMASSADCADCHTPHRNLPGDHPGSSVHPDNLLATCGKCHEKITASFVSFDPHNDPTDPDDNFIVYVIWLLMLGLLLAVFGFFGIHDALWLQRTVVGVLRGEYESEAAYSGQYVRRFSSGNVWLHVVIMVTFLLLALTGLPLRFDDTDWAVQLITLMGGLESARIIHRIAAIGTFAYAAYHLGHIFMRAVVRRERGMFWGPNSMVPQPKDFMDLFANLKHFLYLGDPPKGDRWNYIEKFDYLAVFWGIMMIGLSGLMLWAPVWFTNFVPGWALNAAYIVHSEEALLATGFIFIFHFFHTHLRPDAFPMDIVIFTGKMSLPRFKKERPLEYQRLVNSGELEQYLVDPPTRAERRNAYFWGSLALFIGLALAAGIITALLGS